MRPEDSSLCGFFSMVKAELSPSVISGGWPEESSLCGSFPVVAKEFTPSATSGGIGGGSSPSRCPPPRQAFWWRWSAAMRGGDRVEVKGGAIGGPVDLVHGLLGWEFIILKIKEDHSILIRRCITKPYS